jgi:hypothetical protein
MKKKIASGDLPVPSTLQTAVGLVWGLIDQGQHENAMVLLEGCQSCWPEQPVVALLEQTCLLAVGKPMHINQLGSIDAPAWGPMLQVLNTRHRLNTAARAAATE